MKKIVLSIIVLVVCHTAFAQERFYGDPYFQFHNLIDIDEATDDLYQQIDLLRLTYTDSTMSGDVKGYYVDIPFYVNTDISGENDFNLIIMNAFTWSVLRESKEPIVKRFKRILDEDGNTIGIMQKNEDFSSPISKPGKYYLRLFRPVDQDMDAHHVRILIARSEIK